MSRSTETLSFELMREMDKLRREVLTSFSRTDELFSQLGLSRTEISDAVSKRLAALTKPQQQTLSRMQQQLMESRPSEPNPAVSSSDASLNNSRSRNLRVAMANRI